MNALRIVVVAAAAAVLAGGAATAYAGRTCEPRALRADTATRALDLARSTAQALDATGADVVILARAGQDLSAHGLQWSHLGFAVREAPGQPWRVVHKLNQCGSATSALYRHGLAEFFLDDLHRYEAALVVLSPDLQSALKPVLRDDRRVAALHTPRYNMLAYPWSVKYQQSNQWALETLVLAAEPGVSRRDQAQAWLRFKGYEPTTVRVSTVTRLGARLTRANIEFDDHPGERRFAGRIDTVTVESIQSFLRRTGLGGAVQVVRS